MRNAPRWREFLQLSMQGTLSLSFGIFAGQSDTRVFTNERMQISYCMLEHAVGPSERHDCDCKFPCPHTARCDEGRDAESH